MNGGTYQRYSGAPIQRWRLFCKTFAPLGLVSWHPVADLVLAYVAWLAGPSSGNAFSYDVIKKALSALRFWCLLQTGVTPSGILSRQTWVALKGVKNSRRAGKKLNRVPINAAMVQQMANILDVTSFDDAVFLAAASLGVRGLLRGGEYAVKDEFSCLLKREHVSFKGDMMSLLLERTKTGENVVVKLFRDAVDTGICPVRNMQRALDMAYDKSNSAAALQQVLGQPLTYSRVLAKLKACVGRLNLDPKGHGLHSLRIGGATDLARLGLPESVIRARGRWTSDASFLYQRTDETDLRSAQGKQAKLASKLAGEGLEEVLGIPTEMAYRLEMGNVEEAVSFFQT